MLNSRYGETINNPPVISVLVVDDFAPWRQFILEKLRDNRNLRVVAVVSDGLEAVRQAQALQPQLVLLDLGLPKLNGIAAARQIRKLSPGSKILFLSQEADPDVARAAFSAGGQGYVVKADAESDLLAAIVAVMSGKKFVSRSLPPPAFANIGDLQADDPPRRKESIQAAPSINAEDGPCHHAHFYREDDSLLDGFTHFISAALKKGNAAILVATMSHRDELFQRLQAGGVDIHALANHGRYIALDTAETLATFMVNDLPDRARFLKTVHDLIAKASQAAIGDHPRIAACGECAPILWAQGNPHAAVQLEYLWSEIADTCAVDILCGYVRNSFQREPDRLTYESICAEHSGVRTEWAGY